MTLASRAQHKPVKPPTGRPCSVGVLLATLPEDEAAGLNKMLTDGWTQAQIVEAVRAEGHQIAEQAPGRHLRRDCGCFKAGSGNVAG